MLVVAVAVVGVTVVSTYVIGSLPVVALAVIKVTVVFAIKVVALCVVLEFVKTEIAIYYKNHYKIIVVIVIQIVNFTVCKQGIVLYQSS